MSLIAQAIIAGFVLASAIVFACLVVAAVITWILPDENDLAYDEDFAERYAKVRGGSHMTRRKRISEADLTKMLVAILDLELAECASWRRLSIFSGAALTLSRSRKFSACPNRRRSKLSPFSAPRISVFPVLTVTPRQTSL